MYPLLHPFCSSPIRSLASRCLYISSDIMDVINFQTIGKQVMGLWFPGAVTFVGSFYMRNVLPDVIQSGVCAVSRHSFRYFTSLLRRLVTFLIQKPCAASGPGVFQLGSFTSVFFSRWLIFSILLGRLFFHSSLGRCGINHRSQLC